MKNVSGVTLPVSQLSDAYFINTMNRNDAKYIEYFIASNCYALPFRIRLSDTLLFILLSDVIHLMAVVNYLSFQVGK